MDRLFFLVIALGLVLGLALPGSRPASDGNPRRITTPSEPPHETELERTPSGRFDTYAKVNGQLAKFVVDHGRGDEASRAGDRHRRGQRVALGGEPVAQRAPLFATAIAVARSQGPAGARRPRPYRDRDGGFVLLGYRARAAGPGDRAD